MSDNPLLDGKGLELHHLQALDLQRQAAETRRLLEDQERQRKGVCSCPHCGGGIPKVGVSVCMHCRRNLHWHDGSCGATKEDAEKVARAEAERISLQKLKQQHDANQAAKAQRWDASPEGKIETSKGMGGCLGVLIGVWFVLVMLWDGLFAVNPDFSLLVRVLAIGVCVLIVRASWALLTSAKTNPHR